MAKIALTLRRADAAVPGAARVLELVHGPRRRQLLLTRRVGERRAGRILDAFPGVAALALVLAAEERLDLATLADHAADENPGHVERRDRAAAFLAALRERAQDLHKRALDAYEAAAEELKREREPRRLRAENAYDARAGERKAAERFAASPIAGWA